MSFKSPGCLVSRQNTAQPACCQIRKDTSTLPVSDFSMLATLRVLARHRPQSKFNKKIPEKDYSVPSVFSVARIGTNASVNQCESPARGPMDVSDFSLPL